MKIKAIALTQLQAHPKRDNICPAEVKVKIQRHMERTGQYEPLVVYWDPDYPNGYTIINGHVRFEIAQALGWKKMECAIWDVTPAEAELALATLNTLKGTSDQQKRWDLLASLQSQFPLEDLQLLLPESQEALAPREPPTKSISSAIWVAVRLPVPFVNNSAVSEASP